MDYVKMLQELNALHGPAGDERAVAEKLCELAAPYCDACTIDTLGNLIVHKKGPGPKVMLTAQMDSAGLVVTHIEKTGELRFGKIGPLPIDSMLHTPYRFKNGTCGVIAREGKADEKKLTLQNLFLDIGAKSREEAEKLVKVGDTAVSNLPTLDMNGRIATPHANRLACLALLEAMEQMGESQNDLYFVFTAQDSLGLRGAKTAAFTIAPDFALTIGLTPAEELEGKQIGSSKLAVGAAIKVMDSSVICHPQIVRQLETLATAEKIAFQMDVIRDGQSSGAEIQVSGSGVPMGGVSIPCRYRGTGAETVDLNDVKACAKLAAAFANTDLER